MFEKAIFFEEPGIHALVLALAVSFELGGIALYLLSAYGAELERLGRVLDCEVSPNIQESRINQKVSQLLKVSRLINHFVILFDY